MNETGTFLEGRAPRNRFTYSALFSAASLSVIASALIIYTLASGTIRFFEYEEATFLEFITGTDWLPNGRNPSFGIWPLLSGTALIAVGALMISIPLGVAAALHLGEFASPKSRRFLKPIVEVLSGIPSVVHGFFALLVISPFMQRTIDATYFNAASAIIVVAAMILPIIVSISDDAIRAVPREIKEAALGLGATRWEMATKVVLPSARSGIVAAVLLALARAVGETMAVTMAAGSVAALHFDPRLEVQTLTAYIAQVATGDIPPGPATDAGFAVGSALFVLTYSVNILAIGATRKRLGANRGKMSSLFFEIKAKLSMLLEKLRGEVKYNLTQSNPFIPTKYDLYRRRKEKVSRFFVASSLFVGLAFLLILLQTILETGLAGIDLQFLTNFPSYRADQAGIGPTIWGSLWLIALTMLFALPAGVGAAVYLTELAPEGILNQFLRRTIQNLAAVPSIIFGLVGLYIFSRMFGFGLSLLTGSLTLAMMVLPMIVVTTEEALLAVPKSFRDAALGVGATRWQAVRHHVLPNAVPGIATGAILSVARALGETAPILFVASLFSKTAPTGIMDGFLALPIQIFFWTRHPKEAFHDLAASTILVLLMLLLILNFIAIFIRNRAEARRSW
jgi:phosphate transport system permease protein|tara:strand:+ start:1186 stop:3054 length:1869 start_codon:yes stop_codon:yes gene_type:complete